MATTPQPTPPAPAKFGVILFTAAPEPGTSPQGAFVKVDGRETLLRSVELFVNRDEIAGIVVGINPADADQARAKFGSHALILGFTTATGGPALREQLKAAAAKLPEGVTHVVVHDAARPAVSSLDIDKLLEVAATRPAAALVASVAGMVVRLDESGTLSEPTPARALRHLLYPQSFSKAAFDELLAKGPDALLSRLTPVESSALNLRVHSAADAGLLKALIPLLPKPKARVSTNPFEEAQW